MSTRSIDSLPRTRPRNKPLRIDPAARCDPRLESLPDAVFRVWFRLACLAAHHGGRVPPMRAPILAAHVARGDERLLWDAVDALRALDLATWHDDDSLSVWLPGDAP